MTKKKMKEKKIQQAQKDFEEQLRQRLAEYLVQTSKKYVNHQDHGAARRDAVLQRIAKYRKAKRQYKITEPPRPWPVSNRFGYIVATPVMCAADKKKTRSRVRFCGHGTGIIQWTSSSRGRHCRSGVFSTR
jgi:hypothetical protein